MLRLSNAGVVAEQATERIQNRYLLKGIESLSVVNVTLPENASKNQFAAFDSDGVTIYEYTRDGELVEFGALKWADFHSITIKHLDQKTNFTFYADDRFRKLTVIDGNGEELENFVREHTPAKIHMVELKWYNKIPGFRSETRWKMIMAGIVYLWVLATLYTLISGKSIF